MANYGSPSVIISWNSNVITTFIEKINGIETDYLTDEITGFGQANPVFGAVGFTEMKAVTLEGPWNDAATAALGGTNANFALGTTGTLQVTYGNAHSTSSSCIVTNLKRSPERKKETRFTATLLPTGAITEA